MLHFHPAVHWPVGEVRWSQHINTVTPTATVIEILKISGLSTVSYHTEHCLNVNYRRHLFRCLTQTTVGILDPFEWYVY